MPREEHPYLVTKNHFDSSKNWEYLIIGTFPPNKEVRNSKKSLVDYFYGNKGSIWRILGNIYSEFDFEKGTRLALLKKMKDWQEKYKVGITDTLLYVTRTDINSSKDSDFILCHEDYNHELKNYILNNNETLKKIYFTSNKDCNSAYGTFKYIMGGDINKIKDKIVFLPSPSGSSNTSFFNSLNEKTLGLNEEFYNYIETERKEQLEFFKKRWEQKKKKKETKSKEKLDSCEKGLVTDFKIWFYKNVLPKQIKIA